MGMLQQGQQSASPAQDDTESPTEDSQDTAPAGSADDQGDQSTDPSGTDQSGADAQSDTGDQSSGGGNQASPEEQQSYERAIGALYTVLYKNPKTSEAILNSIQPQAKVDSTAKTCMLLIQQLDQKLHFDETIIPTFTQDVVDHVMELAEHGKKITYSDPEAQAVFGATWEGVLRAFGISKEDAQKYLQTISPEEQKKASQNYSQFLNSAQSDSPDAVAAANSADQGAAPAGDQSQSADQSAPTDPNAAPAAAPDDTGGQ